MSFICLNDLVDTLKIQFYPTNTEIDKLKYNAFVEYLILKKDEAMKIKNEDNQQRFILISVDDIKFRVMATSQSGFNVVCQNADFTLSFRKIGEHKNPVVKAEFRAEFLLRNGYKRALEIVVNFVSTLLKNFNIKVSEIHLAKDVQNYNFSILDFYRLKSLKKNREIFNQDTNLFFNGLKFTGFSIGKGAEMLRIYNKTYEIDKNKNKAFVKYLSWDYNPNFDENKTVWRIEFQLRREKLKQLYSSWGLIENLQSLLNSISSLWDYLINTFVLKDFSIKECQEFQQGYIFKNGELTILNQETIKKRFQRAELSPLWEFIKTFKGNVVEKLQKIKDIKKPSAVYVKNAFKAVLSTFIKLKRGSFSSKELTKILLEADKELQSKKRLNLIDNARLKCIDYVNRARDFFNHTGVDEIEFTKYYEDLKENLNETFALIQGEQTEITTFKEFNKRLKIA